MRINGCVAVAAALSVTWALKLKVPAIVGVPEIIPVAARFNPVGKPPVIILHV